MSGTAKGPQGPQGRRRKTLNILAAAAIFASTGPAQAADDMVSLAAKKGCFTCHSVRQDASATQPLAPSYQEIYERYAADRQAHDYLVPLASAFRAISKRYGGVDDAGELLVERVIKGTVYRAKSWHNANMRWMPPNPQLREEDAQVLVDWILALPPAQTR